MSTKKPVKTDLWRQREKNLRALGVGVDLSGPWSAAKQARIKRASDKWGDIAANPKDFQKINVAKLSPDNRKALVASGYKLHGDTAFVPKQGYDRANITVEYHKGKEPGTYDKTVLVKRSTSDATGVRKRQTEYVGTHLQKLDWRDRLMREYEEGQFKEGERMYLKVYDNSPMVHSQSLTMKSIYAYAERIKWDLGSGGTVASLQNNLHLVKIWTKDNNEASIIKSTSELRSEQKKRARNRRKAGVKKKHIKGRGPK